MTLKGVEGTSLLSRISVGTRRSTRVKKKTYLVARRSRKPVLYSAPEDRCLSPFCAIWWMPDHSVLGLSRWADVQTTFPPIWWALVPCTINSSLAAFATFSRFFFFFFTFPFWSLLGQRIDTPFLIFVLNHGWAGHGTGTLGVFTFDERYIPTSWS